ncbi:L-threonylcarbamoyladenylate synthase [Thermogladius sp. 4427co]|uniref:L-threonylcarbamoyladenylate synthase n=1 Tax=Thermogladius sp. 4427co TaxID=3450718 RepID=UPI003F7B24CD
MTIIARVDPFRPDEEVVRKAAEIIKRGGLVAFPTETVYGLGADVFNRRAVLRVFEVKGRPPDNPLIIHVNSLEMLDEVASSIPEVAYKLISKFWPGPLTLILPKSEKVPYEATGGLDTVAVRMPAHPVALKLIGESQTPIAAPSANISGYPSPTKGEHVIRDLYSKIDMIIDAGDTLYGVESTIINILTDPPTLLRPGAYPVEEIEKAIGKNIVIPEFARGLKEAGQALAPGMRYRHYSPATPLVLIELSDYSRQSLSELAWNVIRLVDQYKDRKVCILATEETKEYYTGLNAVIVPLGSRKSFYEIAHNLFDALRKLDQLGCGIAIAEGFEERGLGLTIMNRLRKACSRRIVI